MKKYAGHHMYSFNKDSIVNAHKEYEYELEKRAYKFAHHKHRVNASSNKELQEALDGDISPTETKDRTAQLSPKAETVTSEVVNSNYSSPEPYSLPGEEDK